VKGSLHWDSRQSCICLRYCLRTAWGLDTSLYKNLPFFRIWACIRIVDAVTTGEVDCTFLGHSQRFQIHITTTRGLRGIYTPIQHDWPLRPTQQNQPDYFVQISNKIETTEIKHISTTEWVVSSLHCVCADVASWPVLTKWCEKLVTSRRPPQTHVHPGLRVRLVRRLGIHIPDLQ